MGDWCREIDVPDIIYRCNLTVLQVVFNLTCRVFCRYIVQRAREIGVADIIDRCNLTVLLEPGQEGLADFLAEHKVRVAASLPCYGAENVDEQRGGGVFARSIEVRLAITIEILGSRPQLTSMSASACQHNFGPNSVSLRQLSAVRCGFSGSALELF